LSDPFSFEYQISIFNPSKIHICLAITEVAIVGKFEITLETGPRYGRKGKQRGADLIKLKTRPKTAFRFCPTGGL
jgi:hypothetical protein